MGAGAGVAHCCSLAEQQPCVKAPAAEGSYLFPVVPGVIGTAESDEATVTAATRLGIGQ